MTIYAARPSALFFLCLVLIGQPAAWADDLDAIRFGESALSFAAGSITKSSPQDGVVNVVTGDNQTVGNRMQLGQRDTLYLKLKNPAEAEVGNLYTVFKRARKVFHPATGEYLGYVVIRLAIVEVTQVDRTLTTVRALRAYGAVSPGDPVVKFSLPVEQDAASSEAASDVAGMIIEAQSDMSMTLVAQRNVVYVDRGRADGLQQGDVMEIFRTGGNLPLRVLGEIKILSTEDRTATALVTKSTARIFRGDRFHVKQRAPEAVPVSGPVQRSESLPERPAPTESALRKFTTQNASRETTITLSDLMKQLRYESGEATIKPEGYEVLDQLIEHLKGAPADQLIRVEGHADNMEIGPSLKSRYPTNWDLSKARASGVLRYLVEKGGIDSARISSIGYGDTKPVVSNATEPGRQRNRRVDIVLYQPESERAPSEQTMNPAALDNGYKVSGLASEGQAARVSAIEPAPAPQMKPMDDQAMTVPTNLVPAASPTDRPSDDRRTDQPVVSQP